MNQQQEDLKAGKGTTTTTSTTWRMQDDTQRNKKTQSIDNNNNNNRVFCVEADGASTFHGRITVGTVMEEDSFSSSSSGGDQDESNHENVCTDCEVALHAEELDDDGAAVNNVDAVDDIFGSRQGKTLTWTNVNMTLIGHAKQKQRVILQEVWGEIPKKSTTAVLGASGCGKTSLLNILSGRCNSSSNSVKISGDIRLDNVSIDPTNVRVRQCLAYVAQQDSLLPTATPREAVMFSAKLRLPKETGQKTLDHITAQTLSELGLCGVENSIIGSDRRKGISGGEKKRVSVGLELVTRPTIILLDEPVSGLDSFSAVQLIKVLRRVANAGTGVLFTIHQPSSPIFATFDHLIVLNKGRVMYQGHANYLTDHLSSHGYPVPEKFSTPDWIMHIAQTKSNEQLESDGLLMVDTRQLDEPIDFNNGKDALGLNKQSVRTGALPSIWDQTRAVFAREFTNVRRDKSSVIARLGITVFLSCIFAVVFFGVGRSDPSSRGHVQSRLGALVMVAMCTMFGAATPFAVAFPEERPRFLREFSSKHYGVTAYFLSKLFFEIFITGGQNFVLVLITYPSIGFQTSFWNFYCATYLLALVSTAFAVFFGSLLSDPSVAIEILPLVFTPQLIFSGFVVSFDLIPKWLRWIRYICSMTYSLWILCLDEFGECSGEIGQQNCEDLLDELDVEEDSLWFYWLVLFALFVVFRLLALVALRVKAKRYD